VTTPSQSKYTNRDSIVYYLLSIPALLLVLVFSVEMAIIIEQIPVPLSWEAVALIFSAIVPIIAISLYLYALLTFRPSTLVILLTLSFFLLTTMSQSVDYYSAVAVIASSFGCLIGFNYARRVRVLSGHEPRLRNSKPSLWSRLVTNTFDSVLPFIMAVGLVSIVASVISLLTAETKILPAPLATLGALYLQTHLYSVLTIVTVAGVTVWALRNLIEPFLMWYTLKPEDAISEANSKLAYDLAMIQWRAWQRPRRGRIWVAASLFTAFVVGLYLLILVGPEVMGNSLLSTVGLARVEPNRPGLLIESSAKNFVRQSDKLARTLQDLIREIIKILWG
jgi:hypothetical protein